MGRRGSRVRGAVGDWTAIGNVVPSDRQPGDPTVGRCTTTGSDRRISPAQQRHRHPGATRARVTT